MKIVNGKAACLRRAFASAFAIASLLVLSTAAFAQQLPQPAKGLNLGNTFEPPCGVGCWGPPMPTQAGINAMAANGFNTLRIPCAWIAHSNAQGVIDPTYMSQVTSVVNWALAANMYVVVNEHWDNGWFENSGFNSFDTSINSKLQNMWTQVANNFKNTSTHLLFACANEPSVSSQAQTNVLFQYHQTFVNTVRGTGGNNATRWLIVQGPGANIDNSCSWVTPSSMPSDPAHSLMLEVHFYDPYQFTQMTTDASWGAMFYFWGAGYHSTTLPSRNATWGEESNVDAEMAKMKTNFVSKGVPVYIGEWRAVPKPSESDLTGANITLNYDSVTYWNYYLQHSLVTNGLTGTCWQTNDIINQVTGAVISQDARNSVLGNSYIPPPGGGGGTIANGTYKVVSRLSGLVLDAYSAGTANGTVIGQWAYGGGNNQRWTVTSLGGGLYSIVNVNANKPLEVTASGGSGTWTELWTSNSGANQKWQITATSGGYYKVCPSYNTSLALDDYGASTANYNPSNNQGRIDVWTYGGGNNQQWAFQSP